MAKTKEQKKALKELNLKKQRKKVSKWVFIGILAALVIAGIYMTYYLIRYNFYNHYRDYITDYEYPEASEFKAAKDSSPSVEGYDLAAENDTLKLYIQEATGNIAVYDKRNGVTVYSNPPGADEDGIANGNNKNYLKSQLIISYYNTQRFESYYDSFTQVVAYNQVKAQSIPNGVRLNYTFGDRSSATGIVPIYISKSTLDDLLEEHASYQLPLPSAQQKPFRQPFQPYALQDLQR